MTLEELRTSLEEDLKKQIITPSVLLDRLRVIDENNRQTSAYVDPRYVPFYYHLGKYLQPKNLVEFGFGLGFFSACFLKSCKTVEHLLAFQERPESFYSAKLGYKNVRSIYRGDFDLHVGNVMDPDFEQKLAARKWDLIIFNEEKDYDKHLFNLDFIWPHVKLDGYIVMDYVHSHESAHEAYKNFCKVQNREPMILPTRYGTGIIQR